ncbi:MAG: type II secretion system protein [Ketobacter sp.]|nr:MAG: type II secretion system protein [Ketobacter sp.]
MCTDRQQGTTLVELVMAIAVAGVLLVGLMTAYSSIVGRSSDPMVRTQSVSLAESYLEEALLKPFHDPGGSVCPASPGGNRENFNNVCDYHNYSAASITLPNGAVVSGLNGYSVAITVTNIAAGELGAIPTSCALKVTVNITSPLNEVVSLTGYRTDYESNPACS